jgi:phosphopantetheine adenylyltransferase
MKSFREFITEARGGKAAEQAQRSGLVSDGHGGWLNRQGLLVAQTQKDRLVFIKPETPDKTPPEKSPAASRTPQTAAVRPPKPKSVPIPKKQKEEEPPPKTEETKSITVVFGKFNPPTSGHLKLLKKARQVSRDTELRIYPSRTQNDQNPLEAKNKIRYMRIAFPEFADEIMNDQSMTTIFDVLQLLNQEGYRSVRIVVGAQRESEFERLSNQYNGELYEYDLIEVVPAAIKDPDSDASDAQSSGALRKAATKNDYFKFKAGLPPKMPEKEKRNLFNAVQNYYQRGSVKETWQLAPELDYKALRESYYKGEIFNVGDLVESQTTGVVGTIKRRGPNYVICVNEELNFMFKPWIQDITEWTDNCGTTEKEKEVGRPERVKYLMRLMGLKKIDNYSVNPSKKSK